MPKKKREGGHAVRIGEETFQILVRLQRLVMSRGWSALGMNGNARQPTLSAVVEQAIIQLQDHEMC